MAAISHSVVWRTRTSGSATNGAGYDSTISGTLSTTLNGSISSGATTVVVTSHTGWPSSGNYYARIGNAGAETFSSGNTGSSEIVLVTGGQGTNSWTVTRAQLGTVAQAFATGVVVDNNLSQCDTAPASGTHGTSNNSTTFSDSTFAAFNATHVGNVIWLASGTNSTAGAYFVESVTNSTTVVLDRACSTAAMTNGAWALGGAWGSNFVGNLSPTWILSGHVVYLRASGSGSLSGADFAWTNYNSNVGGDNTNGYVRFIGENGRPFWSTNFGLCFFNVGQLYFENFYFYIIGGALSFGLGLVGSGGFRAKNVIFDQNGVDCGLLQGRGMVTDCEFLSNTANSGSPGSNLALGSSIIVAVGCNFHDLWGPAFEFETYSQAINCIFARNRGSDCIFNGGEQGSAVIGCTFDGTNRASGSSAIVLTNNDLSFCAISGNIIVNQPSGCYGIDCNFNSTAVNDRLRAFINYNCYFNNANNTRNLTVGSGVQVSGMMLHDTIGVDPQFASESTENLAIGANLKGLGYPQTAYLQSLAGKVATTTFVDPGAVQRAGLGGTVHSQMLLMGVGMLSPVETLGLAAGKAILDNPTISRRKLLTGGGSS